MRDIKFRAKSRHEDVWYYGGIFQTGADCFVVKRGNWEPYLICNIDPNTVGQFTGLYDKNGNEIYEGDIYRYDNPDSINEVSYCTGGGFAGFDLTPAIHSENRLLDVEVIGNIHDNPDLLKGGEKC